MGPMTPFSIVTQIISILIALAVHEWAHAFTAHRLGDPTARDEGRLTLNPISHIDPLGALMFIFVGFGWAKPVPVNPMYFRRPKSGMALTALAGPFSNLVLAAIAFSLLAGKAALDVPLLARGDITAGASTAPGMVIFIQILRDSLGVNLALMAFNLLPVPPLDGSNILRMFIPLRWEEQYDKWLRIGPMVLLGIVIVESFTNIPILSLWVGAIQQFVLNGFIAIANTIL